MPPLPTPTPLDLSGQAVRNGSDKPILISGKAFRFNSVDEPWAIQRFEGHDNMLRTEIRAGYKAPYDFARERPYFRSEISEMERESNTELERWMAFDICMLDDAKLQPYGPDLPPGQAMICQIKTFPDAGSGAPLIRVEARSNGVRVAAAGNDGNGKDAITNWMFPEPVRSDRFESFLIQIIRSPTGTADGTVRLWRNGKQIIDREDVAIGHATTQYTWNKFGLYCRDNVTSAAAVHANMNCGPDLSHLVGRGEPASPAG